METLSSIKIKLRKWENDEQNNKNSALNTMESNGKKEKKMIERRKKQQHENERESYNASHCVCIWNRNS